MPTMKEGVTLELLKSVTSPAAKYHLCLVEVDVAPELRPQGSAEVTPAVRGADAVALHVRPRLSRGHAVHPVAQVALTQRV